VVEARPGKADTAPVTHRFVTLALLTAVACKGAASAGGAAESTGPLRNDEEKTLYALGLHEGQRLSVFNLTPAELAIVHRGLRDQVTGAQAQVQLREWGPRINDMVQARQRQRGEQEKTRGREFAERAAAEAGAVRTPSGLVYKETRAGTGPQPTAEDTVRVKYRGTLINGTEFDSSRGEPVEFPLRGVVPCWTEGMQRIRVGGTARLVCPSDLAYGDSGQREIPPGATLVFEVELVGIVPRPPAAPAASDDAGTPAPGATTGTPAPAPGH
jgi:FKBP-type peptidyl-prolyl cis-trans isomerase FkpA